MGTTNGIELSPDEKILYVNESAQRKIWAFDVDGQGDSAIKDYLLNFPIMALTG